MIRNADSHESFACAEILDDALRLRVHCRPFRAAAGEIDGVHQADVVREIRFDFGVFTVVLKHLERVEQVLRDATFTEDVNLAREWCSPRWSR